MTANRVIYLIYQSPELLKAWRELTDAQKRAVIADCRDGEESDIERARRRYLRQSGNE